MSQEGWGSETAFGRVGVSALIEDRENENDEQGLLQRRPADTPTRRYVSPELLTPEYAC